MRGFFVWAMRHGAKILFALAVLQVATAAGGVLLSLSDAGRGWVVSGYASPGGGLLMQISFLFSAFSGAAFPFFGALLIDRVDCWLAAKRAAEASS